MQSLIVLLLDHHPAPDEVRRIQAQVNNAREELSLLDQQEQLADCWEARAGLLGAETGSPPCAPTSASRQEGAQPAPPAHPPRPDPRPRRRAPHRRAAVGDDGQPPRRHAPGRPELTEAVAGRITSSDLHEKAPARPRRVRAPHRRRGRAHLRGADRRRRAARRRRADRARPRPPHPAAASSSPACSAASPTSSSRARRAHRPRQDQGAEAQDHPEIRDRARAGRYAFVHERGQDFAAGIWVVDPVFMIDLAREELQTGSDDARPRGGVLRRRPDRRRRAPRRRRGRPPAQAAGQLHATPRRPDATSGSGTTSAPG